MSDLATIWLDPDDEITTAVMRLRAAAGERVALVLPGGSPLATSRINFRLLAREAEAVGKRLEIVSPDPGARILAAAAGLVVHAALPRDGAPDDQPVVPPEPRVIAPVRPPDEAQPVPVVGPRRGPVAGRTAALAAAAVFAIVGVAGVLAFMLLPSATITLAPATASVGPLKLVVTAGTDVASPDPVAMTIPAVRTTYDVSVQKSFTTTGIKVAEAPATGTVTLTNCYSGAPIGLRAGTLVSTNAGIAFRLTQAVTVPKATKLGGSVTCSTRDAAVQADQPGLAGNVPAGAIDQPPAGYDPALLSVTNDQATTGGSHTESPQVSQADVDAALAALRTELDAAAQARLDALVSGAGSATVFRETARLGDPTPSVDPATLVGTAAATFDLGLAAQGSVLSVDAGPVTALAAARLGAKVPGGWTLDAASIAIQVGVPTVIGDTVSFPVTASATRARVVDGPALLERVKGLDLPAARAILDDYGAVTIEVWPDWVTTIPTNGRARLDLASPAPVGSPSPGSGVVP